MKTSIVLVAFLLPTIACGRAEPDAEGRGQSRENAVRDTVVEYESQTHGALQVMTADSSPRHWFDVLQNGERAFSGNPKLLNSFVELLPGDYVVDVNRTRRPVTIEAGKKAVLWTGELMVEGGPSGAYWYPMQGTERRVTSNPPLLNTALPVFPGTYTVFVHVSVGVADASLGDARVLPGQTTTLSH